MLTKNPVISCIIVLIIFLSIFICVLNVHCYSFLSTDIDECKESDVPVCSQVCLDVKGHYKCSCVKGYKMENILGKPGKTTCKIDGNISIFSILLTSLKPQHHIINLPPKKIPMPYLYIVSLQDILLNDIDKYSL